MVGSSPIRSSSPMSTRPNPNPIQNPNNPERKGAGVRKSFNGYPLVKSSLVYQQKGLVPNTPVNSPAEYARGLDGRNPGVVSFRDHEQKENQSDLNLRPIARAKSPSVNTKGTKHFMSPTISAASKINPSPRKKVLGERNEAIRTSASLSDGKFHFFSTNSLESDDEHEPNPVMPTSFDKAAEPDKHEFQHRNGSDSISGEVKTAAFEADLVVLSPDVPLNTVKSVGSLPLSEMPSLMIDEAPLEADQVLPPYDPKRNYLSPRPQFLHYNPNWRTENYVNQGMNLEDDFTSESVSEIENSSEEVQSENSLKGLEDVSSVTSSSSSVEVSLEDLPPVSDMNTTESPHLVEMVQAELEPRRSRWFTNWKFVAVLLLISLGFMSILLTSHPAIGNVVYRDEIISRVHNNPHAAALVEHFSVFAENAKFQAASCVDYMLNEKFSRVYNNPHVAALVDHFSEFAENAKFWAASCVDYVSQILQNVRKVDRFSYPAFSNLTAWQEEEDQGFFSEEFEVEPYFGSVEGSQCYWGLQHVQTVLQDYEIKDQASVQMQSYPAPDDNNNSSTDGSDNVELGDSQPEEVKQDHEIEDEASAQMQSYSALEDSENLAAEAELLVEKQDSGIFSGETELTKTVEPEDLKQIHEIKDVASEQMQSYSALEDSENLAAEAELLKAIDSEPIIEENVVTEDSDAVMTEQAFSADESENMADEFHAGEQQTDAKEVSEVSEIQKEVISTNEPSENDNMNHDDDVQPAEKDTSKSVWNSELWKASEKSLAPMAAAIILVIVSLLAAFMYMKPKKESPLVDVDERVAEKEPSVDEPIPSSYSGPVEVDMVGESCPSEMSSFHNSAYTKNKQQDGDEAHSLQKSSKRNVKRESLASSSSEYSKDPSYGSFSTYSIIHPKRGDGEVVTPVRRSSRIRSKVTSP